MVDVIYLRLVLGGLEGVLLALILALFVEADHVARTGTGWPRDGGRGEGDGSARTRRLYMTGRRVACASGRAQTGRGGEEHAAFLGADRPERMLLTHGR